MGLRYLYTREYQGYSRDTILVFADNELKEEEYGKMRDWLVSYDGNRGEVVRVEIVRNDHGPGALINLMIICFNTLLADVSRRDYDRFIDKHRKEFMKHYPQYNSSGHE